LYFLIKTIVFYFLVKIFFELNEVLAEKLVNALIRKNAEPSKSSRICSVRYTEQDFQLRLDACRPLLRNVEVPYIFQ
jgi:hypothetical protein